MNSNTVTVQRANVLLDIPEHQVDYYLSQGYNVIDEYGNIIKESAPTSVGALQKKVREQALEIENLRQQIASLQKQLKSKKPRNSEQTK